MPAREGPRWSRRRFLGRSEWAQAVALNPTGIAAAPHRSSAAQGRPSLRPERFGRIFRLRPFAQASPAVEAALRELGRPGGLLDAADPLSAGPKQLIVDPVPEREQPEQPDADGGDDPLRPVPRPRHDLRRELAAGAGRGSGGDHELPDPGARSQLRLRSRAGSPAGALRRIRSREAQARERRAVRGLAATEDGTAIVADPRNDENLMIAGLHCAFVRFHNNAVDSCAARGSATRRTSSRRHAASRPGTTSG